MKLDCIIENLKGCCIDICQFAGKASDRPEKNGEIEEMK
jgi:hypothetical protein